MEVENLKMKLKSPAILLASALLLFVATAVSAADTKTVFDASRFPAWVESDGLWRTVQKASFKAGAQYAPTDEKLKTIMRLVSLTPTSTGKTDYLLVVLKDVNQQLDVLGPNSANSGTVTVLVFGDRLLSAQESVGKHAQQLDRGYYNAGIASGYLNLAAISLGYGTHFFMTSQYATQGARKQTIEDTYLKGKGYKYTFGYDANKQGDAKGQADAYGNLKFICAIMIGTLDEKAESKVTDHGYPENWVVAK
jgi:hypothetical protein